ncbi:MAG: cell division protein FtsX [Campylobacterales bacterium]|nr:cell division protein FtsX [Campylobacterales bacterium]
MRLVRSVFAFVMPLLIMLLTFSVYLIVNNVVNSYKKNITNDYAIVVITNTPMIRIDEIANVKIKDLEVLSRDKIIDSVKENLSDSILKLLGTKLPYFYKLYLEEFPTTSKLEQIRKELTVISNVKRVETFSTDHNKVYSLLVLLQDIVVILFVIMSILSILLVSKQIKIWFYEHQERLQIIQLHGGSLMYGSKPILNIMLLSSLISTLSVSLIVYFLMENINLVVQPELLSIIPNSISLIGELIKIILLGFALPVVTYLGLIIKYKSK